MNVLIFTDNLIIYKRFKVLVSTKEFKSYSFRFASSPDNCLFKNENIPSYKINESLDELIASYNVIISLHCLQIFPKELISKVRCYNVHPGFNPYNRGWYPQVFSIINRLPAGATIHEMDELLDHGKIIDQKMVKINKWDTSLTLYNKIIDEELILIENNLKSIIDGKYKKIKPSEGNLNLRKDFKDLCKIELDDVDTFENHLNKLRALTHGIYKNAFFLDGNKKVFVKVEFEVIDK